MLTIRHTRPSLWISSTLKRLFLSSSIARLVYAQMLCESDRRQKTSARLASTFENNDFIGRDGVIRTLDPLHPMQVRYQAALRPDI
jgi:hypothetical protein